MTIERIEVGDRMSQAVIHNGVVYLAGQVAMTKGGTSYGEQTEEILRQIDGLLDRAGTDKSKVLRATIWIADMARFDEMNEVWDGWVSPGNTPVRACVEAKLAFPQFEVEIMVEAAV